MFATEFSLKPEKFRNSLASVEAAAIASLGLRPHSDNSTISSTREPAGSISVPTRILTPAFHAFFTRAPIPFWTESWYFDAYWKNNQGWRPGDLLLSHFSEKFLFRSESVLNRVHSCLDSEGDAIP